MSYSCWLPDPKSPNGEIHWQLTKTGLEWEGGRFKAAWMPFACMRLICIGNLTSSGGWRMRISGPPGAVIIDAGRPGELAGIANIQAFRTLSESVVSAALSSACDVDLRRNDRHIRPSFLWARLGKEISSLDELLGLSAPSVT